jgi:inward rectifier potassium channel
MSEPPSAPPSAPPSGRSGQTRTVSRGRSTDIVRLGLQRRPFGDLYHHLLNASWWHLGGLVLGAYLSANTLFATLYLLDSNGIENARPGSFFDRFFFSVQTMATIGYGKMSPVGGFANVLVTIEALTGVVGLALLTGLVFAKFSRPTARVLFSRVAVITTFEGKRALLFRMANERSNQIVEAQLRLVFARNVTTAEGVLLRRFMDLELQRKQTAIFALTWMAVHDIDERSPLHDATPEALRAIEAELIVSVVGFDDTFSQTVHARHSYIADEIVWNARFEDVLSRLPDGRRKIDYTKFHEVISE